MVLQQAVQVAASGGGGVRHTHTQEDALHLSVPCTLNSHDGLLQLGYVVLVCKEVEEHLSGGSQLA